MPKDNSEFYGTVDGWLVQQVLMFRSPADVNTISGACRALAKDYGLTPETLRCYASKGVPSRSKVARLFISQYADFEAKNNAQIQKINATERELIESIGRASAAFGEAAKSLSLLKESMMKDRGEK